MLHLSVVLVLTSALAVDISTAELIAMLGSADRVVREEAARTLEERGDLALSALRTARDLAKTPEARKQLADMIARLESRSLDRPTMVALDFDDRPLGEAVAALARRSGFALELDDPALAGRRVTVRAPGPLPFWEALDRLGRAGHVRHHPAHLRNVVGKVNDASTVYLVSGVPPAFSAYSGPLRIHLFATHRHGDVNFDLTRGASVPRKNAMVTIDVQAFAEPGRFINPNGLPRLEAVDEQGRAIAPQPGGGSELPKPTQRSWLSPGKISLLHWHVPLGLPHVPVQAPLKLRGVLPVVITSRMAVPLVIPMADAVGKTFHQGTSILRIDKVAARNTRDAGVHLLVSEDAAAADRTRVSSGPQEDHVGDYLANRLEFQDAQGVPLSFVIAFDHPFPTPGGELRFRILVGGNAPPARLLIYRLQRLATEIPFEFRDVPPP